jgi:hypothetical protein
VLARPGRGLDSTAIHIAEQELQRLLLPANIRIVLKDRQERDDRFEELVVTSFSGNCEVSELAPSARVRGTKPEVVLGKTPVRPGGEVLPFFTVDCDHVIRLLRPTMDRISSAPLRQSMLGRALGRVMAHEIYHILAGTEGHDESGVAKGSFSMADLMSEHFAFNPSTVRRLTARPAISRVVTANEN